MNLSVLLSFQRLSDAEYKAFCENVITRTENKQRYQALASQVQVVKTNLADFSIKLSAASDGGKALTTQKNASRAVLEDSMRKLAQMVELNADNESYVLEAGFALRTQSQKSDMPLPDPSLEYLIAGVLEGTAEGKAATFPTGVIQIAVEWRELGGNGGWTNGTYSTGLKFTLAGLPSRKEIEVRIIYLGTFSRKSNPSQPLPVWIG